MDEAVELFGSNSFADAIPAPGSARIEKELARSARIPGGQPWPSDMELTLRNNVVRTYGEKARPFQLEILDKLSLGGSNTIITPHDENALIRAPHDSGSTTALLIHSLTVAISMRDALAPPKGHIVYPTVVIMVVNTREAGSQAYAYLRQLADGLEVSLGLWHGQSDRSQHGPGDMDAGHILITTAGMLKTKIQRNEIDISKLRLVVVDNANRLLGVDGKKKYDNHVKSGVLAAINQVRSSWMDVQVLVIANRETPSAAVQEETNLLLGIGPDEHARELVAARRKINNRWKLVQFASPLDEDRPRSGAANSSGVTAPRTTAPSVSSAHPAEPVSRAAPLPTASDSISAEQVRQTASPSEPTYDHPAEPISQTGSVSACSADAGDVDGIVHVVPSMEFRFVISYVSTDTCESLYLAGDFPNGGAAWEPKPMRRAIDRLNGEHTFRATCQEPAGTYQYKFRTGSGEWFCDPSKDLVIAPGGYQNNEIVVSIDTPFW